MSWYADTLYPALESTFPMEEPPVSPQVAADELRMAGHTAAADYVARLGWAEYEDVLWRSCVFAIERDRPEDDLMEDPDGSYNRRC